MCRSFGSLDMALGLSMAASGMDWVDYIANVTGREMVKHGNGEGSGSLELGMARCKLALNCSGAARSLGVAEDDMDLEELEDSTPNLVLRPAQSGDDRVDWAVVDCSSLMVDMVRKQTPGSAGNQNRSQAHIGSHIQHLTQSQ